MSDHATVPHPATAPTSRRTFLKRTLAGVALSGLSTSAYAFLLEPHWLAINYLEMPITHLPDQLVGKRLVQISDLHVGPTDEAYLLSAFKKVAQLKPDLLCITGDFMTCVGHEMLEKTSNLLSHLQPAKLHTVAILGNHDYGHRWNKPKIADELTDRLRSLGIDVQRNSHTEVAGLQIAGFDDYWAKQTKAQQTLKNLDPNKPAIVLCHNPDVLDLSVWNGYQGWILSGHTHGGQCQIPFYGAPRLPVLNAAYTEGHVPLSDGRDLYVNRGLGYSFQIRFNARPEITVFTLSKKVL